MEVYCVSEGEMNKFAFRFCNNLNLMSKFIVNVAVTNVYEEPSFKSGVVSQALLGESCEIIEQSGNWYHIRQWDHYESWAYGFFGTIRENAYSVTHHFFNHAGQIVNPDGQVLRTIHFGIGVQAERHGDQYFVHLPDEQEGFVRQTLSNFTLTPSRQALMETALSFLGVPYAWGGKSSTGVDCSGFVQTVYKSHGISFPRDAHQQSAFLKNETELNLCQPGDLLFFAEKEAISHVAISLGGSQFIHSRGWVHIESLAEADDHFNPQLKDYFVRAVSTAEFLQP